MKRKITLFFTTLLATFSVLSFVYACTPNFYATGDNQQLCPGLYKISNWRVQTSFGSQGNVFVPVATTASGGCGYQTWCDGQFRSWKPCWPGFHPPVASPGCWRQNVTAYSANCSSLSCAPQSPGASNECECKPGVTTPFSVGAGGASCNSC